MNDRLELYEDSYYNSHPREGTGRRAGAGQRDPDPDAGLELLCINQEPSSARDAKGEGSGIACCASNEVKWMMAECCAGGKPGEGAVRIARRRCGWGRKWT